MQIKSTMRYYFTPTRIAINNNKKLKWTITSVVEKLKFSYTTGENVKWYSCLGKVWQFLKRLNTELPYDTAIPFLGIYPGEMKTYAHTIIHKCS